MESAANVKNAHEEKDLEQRAIAAVLAATNRAKIRVEIAGSAAWRPCTLPKTNKRFLRNVIGSVLHDKRHQEIEKREKDREQTDNVKRKRSKHSREPYTYDDSKHSHRHYTHDKISFRKSENQQSLSTGRSYRDSSERDRAASRNKPPCRREQRSANNRREQDEIDHRGDGERSYKKKTDFRYINTERDDRPTKGRTSLKLHDKKLDKNMDPRLSKADSKSVS